MRTFKTRDGNPNPKIRTPPIFFQIFGPWIDQAPLIRFFWRIILRIRIRPKDWAVSNPYLKLLAQNVAVLVL